MDYNEYLEKSDEIKKTNNALLELFRDDLKKSNLSSKTISRHVANAEFYINDFLLYYEALPMESGLTMIYEFLGDFFIRKCMWSTPASIKTTATSIKKFYKCMLDHKFIEKIGYDILCATIKGSMETWQEECAIYNDPDEPNPFFFF